LGGEKNKKDERNASQNPICPFKKTEKIEGGNWMLRREKVERPSNLTRKTSS